MLPSSRSLFLTVVEGEFLGGVDLTPEYSKVVRDYVDKVRRHSNPIRITLALALDAILRTQVNQPARPSPLERRRSRQLRRIQSALQEMEGKRAPQVRRLFGSVARRKERRRRARGQHARRCSAGTTNARKPRTACLRNQDVLPPSPCAQSTWQHHPGKGGPSSLRFEVARRAFSCAYVVLKF